MKDKPLISHIFTADPSAHSFQGKIFIYPSHDRDEEFENNDNGDQYMMEDYHVFSMESATSEVVDHGVVLHVDDIPWVSKQLWAPDAAEKDGKYYFYFPARDKDNMFRLGVAVSDKPEGPFTPQPNPMKNSFSIDPCVFTDDDGSSYIMFGGLWGGQLEKYESGSYDADAKEPREQNACQPRIAKLSDDMLEFGEDVKRLVIVDENGEPLKGEDEDRRYFEGPCLHKYNGTYYFSYSTGTTHKICYATSKNIYGPYTYQGVILNPVLGWTSHHYIMEFDGKWYLFYHDCEISGGINEKRNVKMREIRFESDGSIKTMDP